MALAQLTIDIEARLGRLEEGLDKAARINAKAARDVEQRWESAGTALKTALAPIAAAFSVVAIQQFILTNARAVDSLNDISDATGSTVENISALQDVAKRTGTDIAVVETSLIKLNQALSAAKPGSDAEKALTAIGLSAKELKKDDPAEALRKVAVALSGFADDGNKARLVQELFGKSLREVAPLLKDLATQTQLTASVTKEQADQAERFVHALGQFDAATTRARQALLTNLLPPLTAVIDAFNRGGFSAAGGQVLGFSQIDREFNALKNAARELDAAQKAFEAGAAGDDFLKLEGDVIKAQSAVDRLRASFLKLNDGKAGGGRGFVVPPGTPIASVGDPFGPDPKVAKDRAAELARIAQLIVDGEEQAAKDATEAWKAWEAIQVANHKESADAFALQWKQVFDFIDQEQERAIEEGQAFLKVKTEEMSEFAKQAQRNIQDALGDSLKSLLKGDFDDIGRLWLNLLLDMAAQAAAVNLNQFLFGNDKTKPFSGGVLGPLIGSFIPGFADGTDFVPRTGLALVHQGERITPAAQNRGSGITIVQNNSFSGGANRAEFAAFALQVRQATLAAVDERQVRGLR